MDAQSVDTDKTNPVKWLVCNNMNTLMQRFIKVFSQSSPLETS